MDLKMNELPKSVQDVPEAQNPLFAIELAGIETNEDLFELIGKGDNTNQDAYMEMLQRGLLEEYKEWKVKHAK